MLDLMDGRKTREPTEPSLPTLAGDDVWFGGHLHTGSS